jgi:uncharacterized surface protein with fasciclin (FAS1) repeats
MAMTEGQSKRRALAALAAGAGMLLIPACTSEPAGEAAEGEEPGSGTLASMIADDGDLSVVTDALGNVGLSQVFDGAAAYTILAPQDAVFQQLGEAGEDLRSEEQRAAMAAILRDHIVPGYLTPDDIRAAIEQSDDGTVEMTSMADRTLTFISEGDIVTVKAEDGATARFTGEALRASNGVAIPVDGLLKAVQAGSKPSP